MIETLLVIFVLSGIVMTISIYSLLAAGLERRGYPRRLAMIPWLPVLLMVKRKPLESEDR